VRDTVLEMGVRGRDNGFMEEPSSFVEKRLYCQGCFYPVRGKAYFLRVSRWASAGNKGLPALVKNASAVFRNRFIHEGCPAVKRFHGPCQEFPVSAPMGSFLSSFSCFQALPSSGPVSMHII